MTGAEDALAALVRRADPDRFLTALFAPAVRRPALMTLYAFNHELARAAEVSDQPMIGLIRLQWWREVVEGAARRHEVAAPVSAALEAGVLSRGDLLALIAAREDDIERPRTTIDDWRSRLLAGPGALAVAAARALDASKPETLRMAGALYGGAGEIRSARTLASRGRVLIPPEALATAGLSAEALAADPSTPALAEVQRRLAAALRDWRHTGGIERAVIAAALPAVLARRDLRHPGAPARRRGIGDRLAVMTAAMRARA